MQKLLNLIFIAVVFIIPAIYMLLVADIYDEYIFGASFLVLGTAIVFLELKRDDKRFMRKLFKFI